MNKDRVQKQCKTGGVKLWKASLRTTAVVIVKDLWLSSSKQWQLWFSQRNGSQIALMWMTRQGYFILFLRLLHFKHIWRSGERYVNVMDRRKNIHARRIVSLTAGFGGLKGWRKMIWWQSGGHWIDTIDTQKCWLPILKGFEKLNTITTVIDNKDLWPLYLVIDIWMTWHPV